MSAIDGEIARLRAGWLWTAESGLIHIGRNGWGLGYCGARVGNRGRYTADVTGRRNPFGEKPCRKCARVLFKARAAEDQMLMEHGFLRVLWQTGAEL